MPRILLINPNTSEATTRMMVDIATRALPVGWTVAGRSAQAGPPMITTGPEIRAAAHEVLRVWHAAAAEPWDGVVISAFGDPGIELVRAATDLPVVGICEASLQEAAADGRRFGVATVTPDLAEEIHDKVRALGLAEAYTGIRLTPGDPRLLAADPDALERALAVAARACLAQDGAQAVVIGGGPLGQAAEALQPLLRAPVVAPIPAAARQLIAAFASTC